jgi:hypothetical protein
MPNAGNDIQKQDYVMGLTGGVSVRTSKFDHGNGAGFEEDHSNTQLAQADGSQINLMSGGRIRIEAPSDISVNAQRNKRENIFGDSDISIGRDGHVAVDGKVSVNIGRYSSKEKDASKKLSDLAATIQNEAIQAAKSTTDNRMPCKNCNSSILTQPSTVAIKINTARALNLMNMVDSGFKHIILLLKRVFWLVPDVFRKVKTASFHPKGSCGSKDCVNHTVPDLKASLDNYNKTAINLIEKRKDEIEELQKSLGQSPGGLHLVTKGACFISTGIHKNLSKTVFEKGHHVLQTGMKMTKDGLAVSTAGSPKKTVQVEAIRLTEADMYLNVSEKFTVNAGAPGIALETNGPLDAKAASVEIRANEGEAHFGSGNLTVVNGSFVKIQGGNKAGETGILLDSDNVHVAGGLSVQGNVSFKGGIHTDSSITAAYLNIPSVEQRVRNSRPPQEVSAHGSWWPMNILKNAYQEFKDITQRDVPDPGRLLSVEVMVEYVKKYYAALMGAVPLELRITGWCVVTTMGWTTPGMLYAWCSVGGGPVTPLTGFPDTWSIGTLKGLCPVFNLPHAHGKHNEMAGGTVTSPLFSPYDLVEGATIAGTAPSHIPIPAPTKSIIGVRPGPVSHMGPCGGGGLFVKDRNESYGADPDNPFNGINGEYVSLSGNPGLSGNNWTWSTPDYSVYTFGIKPLTGTGIANADCT